MTSTPTHSSELTPSSPKAEETNEVLNSHKQLLGHSLAIESILIQKDLLRHVKEQDHAKDSKLRFDITDIKHIAISKHEANHIPKNISEEKIQKNIKLFNTDLSTHKQQEHLRGGMPAKNQDDSVYSALLAKIHGYREKIISNKTTFRSQNSFYLEPLAVREYLPFEEKFNALDAIKEEDPDLAIELRKNFLGYDNSVVSKTCLLTGQAGIGKTVFCKQFQRDLLEEWGESRHHESDYLRWLPIYIEQNKLLGAKMGTIAEILTEELSLTNEEIKRLQYPKSNDHQLPHLLIILDGIEQKCS